MSDPRTGDSAPSAGFAGAIEFGGRFGTGTAPPSEDILTTVSGYTIVVPAFNEESGLPTVLEELGRACPEAEIVVVDDGSTDGTGSVAREFPVTVVSHAVNRGYGAALKTGLAQATVDVAQVEAGEKVDEPREKPAAQPVKRRLPGVVAALADHEVGAPERLEHGADAGRVVLAVRIEEHDPVASGPPARTRRAAIDSGGADGVHELVIRPPIASLDGPPSRIIVCSRW